VGAYSTETILFLDFKLIINDTATSAYCGDNSKYFNKFYNILELILKFTKYFKSHQAL